MPVKIRLQRRGRKKSPFYHIVVADARAPRDGRFIEKLGTYNPMTKPATIELNRDSAYEWLLKGAQPTDTARAILRFKGVLYRKHLMRGVKKGALTEEKANEMYQEWIEKKEARIAERRAETAAEIAAFREMINGKAPAPKKKAVESELTASDEHKPSGEPKTLLETVEVTTVESLSGDAPAEAAAETTEEPPADETNTAEATAVAAAAAATVVATETAVETPAAEATPETPSDEVVPEAPAAEAATETVTIETTETVNVGDLDPELAALNAKSEEE